MWPFKKKVELVDSTEGIMLSEDVILPLDCDSAEYENGLTTIRSILRRWIQQELDIAANTNNTLEGTLAYQLHEINLKMAPFARRRNAGVKRRETDRVGTFMARNIIERAVFHKFVSLGGGVGASLHIRSKRRVHTSETRQKLLADVIARIIRIVVCTVMHEGLTDRIEIRCYFLLICA